MDDLPIELSPFYLIDLMLTLFDFRIVVLYVYYMIIIFALMVLSQFQHNCGYKFEWLY